jgi:hypothetical protein
MDPDFLRDKSKLTIAWSQTPIFVEVPKGSYQIYRLKDIGKIELGEVTIGTPIIVITPGDPMIGRLVSIDMEKDCIFVENEKGEFYVPLNTAIGYVDLSEVNGVQQTRFGVH